MKKMLPRYTWTRSAEQAAATIDAVCETRQAMLVVGGPGSGKTAFTLAVCDRAATPRRLVRVEVRAAGTARCITQGVLASLGWAPQGSARADVALLGQLLPLLGVEAVVIDDAHLLSAPGFDVLRQLQDVAQVGLVLCGPPRLWRLLRGRCPELAHRVVGLHELATVDRVDMFGLVNDAPVLEGRADLADLADLLLRATGGNVGRLVQTLEETRRRSRRSHRAVNPRLLHRVSGEIEQLHRKHG